MQSNEKLISNRVSPMILRLITSLPTGFAKHVKPMWPYITKLCVSQSKGIIKKSTYNYQKIDRYSSKTKINKFSLITTIRAAPKK
jgi:hypothetical protein